MNRDKYITRIQEGFTGHGAVALLGPRQCGKTTLAQMYAQKHQGVTTFDLEDPVDLARLENPVLALDPCEGLIIIDEIQRRPELFPILRVLIDRHKKKQQYLILGSASRDLIQQSSETLAGRIAYIEVTPFSLTETGNMHHLWLAGGYPRAYLAEGDQARQLWLKNYTTTFLEQDIPNLGIKVSPAILRRFWLMLAHYHGNIFNMSELGRSLGVSHVTVRHYLDILVSTFIVRELQPWFENISKRQIKSPKIYLKDSGIFHYLMNIHTQQDLLRHPKLGASWEGFALEQVIRAHEADAENCFFWGVHNQAELDLLITQDGKRLGFEFKYNDAPKLTTSMKTALEHLELDSLQVIYPGTKDYTLAEGVKVCGLTSYISQTL